MTLAWNPEGSPKGHAPGATSLPLSDWVHQPGFFSFCLQGSRSAGEAFSGVEAVGQPMVCGEVSGTGGASCSMLVSAHFFASVFGRSYPRVGSLHSPGSGVRRSLWMSSVVRLRFVIAAGGFGLEQRCMGTRTPAEAVWVSRADLEEGQLSTETVHRAGFEARVE